MEQFRYVGREIPPGKITLFNTPGRSLEERHETEVKVFSRLFREQVTATLRGAGGIFRRSVYIDLSAQHGAFDRLMEIVTGHDYDLLTVTRASYERDEFTCKARVQIPVQPQFYDELFTQGVPAGHKGYVVVALTLGVCKDFTLLMKQNEFMEAALKDIAANVSEVADPFNPERVIPGLLKQMRAERRFPYIAIGEEAKFERYYQTAEGFIYKIEIEGYATKAPAEVKLAS